MDIVSLSNSLSADRLNSQSSVLVAKKALDLQKQQGQNNVALIQKAAPVGGDGKGTLVDFYA